MIQADRFFRDELRHRLRLGGIAKGDTDLQRFGIAQLAYFKDPAF